MRRIAALLAPLVLAAVAVTGCGSSGGGSSGPAKVTVTGKFGSQPTVNIPSAKAASTLQIQTLIHGSGPALTAKDAFVGNYIAFTWDGTTHKFASSTFNSAPTLFAGNLLPGIEDAVKGEQADSRVLAVVPPKYGYGSQGYAQNGVKPTTTLVFVIDILHIFAGNASASGANVSSGGHGLPTVSPGTGGTAPTVTIPKGKQPPTTLVAKTLIKGPGPRVAPGQSLVVQYTGVIWRTGKVFDSSWGRGYPFGFTIGASPAQVITGWEDGLLHQTVGSRVLLVIPPKYGYGSAGSSQAGIKGTDTLVFVVDILGAFSRTS